MKRSDLAALFCMLSRNRPEPRGPEFRGNSRERGARSPARGRQRFDTPFPGTRAAPAPGRRPRRAAPAPGGNPQPLAGGPGGRKAPAPDGRPRPGHTSSPGGRPRRATPAPAGGRPRPGTRAAPGGDPGGGRPRPGRATLSGGRPFRAADPGGGPGRRPGGRATPAPADENRRARSYGRNPTPPRFFVLTGQKTPKIDWCFGRVAFSAARSDECVAGRKTGPTGRAGKTPPGERGTPWRA